MTWNLHDNRKRVVGLNNPCRRPVVHLSYATKSYRVNRPLENQHKGVSRSLLVCLFVCLFVCLSVCLFIRSFVRSFVCCNRF